MSWCMNLRTKYADEIKKDLEVFTQKKQKNKTTVLRGGGATYLQDDSCFSLYLKVITAHFGAHLSATVCQGHEQVEQDV